MSTFIQDLPLTPFLVIVGVFAGMAALLAFAASHSRKIAAAIKATPTSNVNFATDGYVEFEGSENNLTHVAGLAQVSGSCPFPCTDSDPGIADLNFGLALNIDGRVYVLEGGAIVPGPDVNNSFGTYTAGERFRVKLKDNLDGTAVVTYARIVGACVPGNPCNETVFFTHAGPAAVYPLRVDTSFREQNATLANVNIVRIQ